ncbi:hypothetical protein E2C01_079818 [Portunus trituberculatus]|uniref:Uncharacterized protein n=1 Tax=Portunus trituberculatus TaxID=210409 RepID=A0A5B7ISB5_PORTR|nr:hypothetical protein [Portunus trituberculatus]
MARAEHFTGDSAGSHQVDRPLSRRSRASSFMTPFISASGTPHRDHMVINSSITPRLVFWHRPQQHPTSRQTSQTLITHLGRTL